MHVADPDQLFCRALPSAAEFRVANRNDNSNFCSLNHTIAPPDVPSYGQLHLRIDRCDEAGATEPVLVADRLVALFVLFIFVVFDDVESEAVMQLHAGGAQNGA